MLKLLEAFNYSVPKIKPYQSGKLEVIFADRYQDFVLFVDGKQQMTYNIHNHHQAYELYSQYDIAEGHCLCSGLGFLVRENWLLTKKEVTKITVIEKSKDVITRLTSSTTKGFNFDVYTNDLKEKTKYSIKTLSVG